MTRKAKQRASPADLSNKEPRLKVILVVGDRRIVRLDQYNLAVQRRMVTEKGQNVGKVYWLNEAFQATMPVILRNLIKRMLADEIESAEAQTVQDLVSRLETIQENLHQTLMTACSSNAA